MLLASLAALPLVLLGGDKRSARPSELERHTVRSLRRLVGDEVAEAMPLRPDDWSRPRALEHLLFDLSPGQRDGILSDQAALLQHLERLQRRDLDEGRLLFVDDWLLSATEVSVAALIAPSSVR